MISNASQWTLTSDLASPVPAIELRQRCCRRSNLQYTTLKALCIRDSLTIGPEHHRQLKICYSTRNKLKATSLVHNTMQRAVRRSLCRAARCRHIRPMSGAHKPVRLLHASPSMPSSLPPVHPPISTQLPADSFQVLPETEKPLSEDALYDSQVRELKDWWASDRFAGVKRPYTADDVVSKRGTLQQTYPSSLMARKLFNLFKERSAKGEPVHTRKLPPIPSLDQATS